MSGPSIPVLSQANVRFIEKLINDHPIDAMIEYGSGNSTLYFLDKYQSEGIRFISVENTKYWFYRNIQSIKSKFQCRSISIRRKYWNAQNYKDFFNREQEPYTPIIDGASRVDRWKRAMELGPFFRFEPDSASRFEGKLKRFRPLFVLINRMLRKLPAFRHERTVWNSTIQNLKFHYQLVGPSMKDQFGESPNRDDFVGAGVENLTDRDTTILVMIDAGPRHFIVDEILRLLPEKSVHVCLFDAHRPEYEAILNKYSGQFYKGNTTLLDGTDFYASAYPDAAERDAVLSKELWYYFAPPRKP